MPTVPINITGTTYPSRSRPLSNQLTQNFYAERVDTPAALSPFVLHAFPGMTYLGTGSGVDRGLFEHNRILYHVAGSTLYSVSASGVHTSLGTIPGTGRCIFAGMGSNVVIVSQGAAYQWNGSAIAEITDADLETPNSCAHLNNQMIYDGDGGRFGVSDVGDATSINGLNYATAESNADDIVRVYVFDQQLYLMGEETIERWWNSGVGNPPFDRVEGGIIEVGLAAIHSVANDDQHMFFLGDDSHVYVIQAGAAQRVTDIATHREIAKNETVTDAIGFTFGIEGQQFYCLTLPAQDKTFLYSETAGWTTLSSGDSGGRTFANSFAFAHRKPLIADYRSAAVYEWDVDTFDDNGESVIRIRDTGPLHGGLVGAPNKRIEMNAFELILETGTGTVSGEGFNPTVALQVSDDGGKTWSTEMWESVGNLGEFMRGVRWTALGSFYTRLMRVKISDPIFTSIHGASADLEVGI